MLHLCIDIMNTSPQHRCEQRICKTYTGLISKEDKTGAQLKPLLKIDPLAGHRAISLIYMRKGVWKGGLSKEQIQERWEMLQMVGHTLTNNAIVVLGEQGLPLPY